MQEVIHKKTGNIYHVVLDNVINCTNKQDGQIMTLYYKDGQFFIRETEEFKAKFEVRNA